MTTIREAVTEAYKTAMKSRDEAAVRALRLLNSDFKKLEVDERRPATEAEVIQFLQRNIKKRREAIDAARTQGRDDVIAAETAEMTVLERFLPAQMSESELVALVEATIKETGAASKKEQGKVMSALMPKLAGRADGKLAAKLVAERLA